LTLGFALAWPAFATGPALVDRGLAQASLNNVCGDYRGNVRWSLYESEFLRYDFQVSAAAS